jgi:tetratricopeptide (TPR) repeat protein
MKRLVGIAFCMFVSLAAHAQYVVAPEIASEYRELKARIQKQPEDVNSHFEYAICLSYLGKIEEGRTVLKQVRAMDPEFARHALPKYLKKHQDAPGDPKAKYRLGFLYYFIDNYDEALRYMGDVAEHKPVGQLTAWALGYMAVVKGKQEKWEEAEDLVRRALAIEPHAYGLHAALALVLKKRGKPFAAVRAYYTALNEREKFELYEKKHLQ